MGRDYEFVIRGQNKDGYAILREGRAIYGDWLYNNVDSAGQLSWHDIQSDMVDSKTGVIAFRFGRNNDLVYCIMITDGMVFTNEEQYWKHPNESKVEIHIEDPSEGIIRYYARGEVFENDDGSTGTATPRDGSVYEGKFKNWRWKKRKVESD